MLKYKEEIDVREYQKYSLLESLEQGIMYEPY